MAHATFQLFLGRKIGQVGYITDSQFSDFLRLIVDCRFESYTLQYGHGFYKRMAENVSIISISCNVEEKYKINQIAELYKSLFNQESIGIVTLPAMEFI